MAPLTSRMLRTDKLCSFSAFVQPGGKWVFVSHV